MPLQTSAQGAQKLRTDTRLRSAERSSLKCSGELTVTRLSAGKGEGISERDDGGSWSSFRPSSDGRHAL